MKKLIITFILCVSIITVFSIGNDSIFTNNDSILFTEKINFLKEEKDLKLNERIIKAALTFLNTPYTAKTLEINSNEELVVNLRGLDCATYIETVLSITKEIISGDTSFAGYKELLKKIRYRKGIIDGYESRLHYFSDWIFDNQKKGIIRDITKEMGGIPYTKVINFMSKHSELYPQLANNIDLIGRIDKIETEISSRDYYYIPKENVGKIESKLEEGMIVAITSAIEGLDIAHNGFLIKVNGRIHLLHASSDKKQVVISEKTLVDYLSANKNQTGIMVLIIENRGSGYQY